MINSLMATIPSPLQSPTHEETAEHMQAAAHSAEAVSSSAQRVSQKSSQQNES